MFDFITYTRVAEFEEKIEINQNNEEETQRKETGKYSVLLSYKKLPFIPVHGMSIKFLGDSQSHDVMETQYDAENQEFSLFFHGEFINKSDYENRINHLINHENWEIVESDEMVEAEQSSTGGKKDSSIN